MSTVVPNSLIDNNFNLVFLHEGNFCLMNNLSKFSILFEL